MKKCQYIVAMLLTILLMGCNAFDDTSSYTRLSHEDQSTTIKDAPINYRDPYSYLVLVNRWHGLEVDFSPRDLRQLNVLDYTGVPATTMYMRDTAAYAVENLFQAANNEAGFTLLARSAYRSYEDQMQLYYHKLQIYGADVVDDWVAYPGHSEHQTGLALDVAAYAPGGIERPFAYTLESQWLAENAHRFGFIIRYPQGREEETGVMFEPWHIRYVGVEVATEIYRNGWILEEFLQHHVNSN